MILTTLLLAVGTKLNVRSQGALNRLILLSKNCINEEGMPCTPLEMASQYPTDAQLALVNLASQSGYGETGVELTEALQQEILTASEELGVEAVRCSSGSLIKRERSKMLKCIMMLAGISAVVGSAATILFEFKDEYSTYEVPDIVRKVLIITVAGIAAVESSIFAYYGGRGYKLVKASENESLPAHRKNHQRAVTGLEQIGS
eukprot:NODE_734_length_4350_cov_0.639849.p3 type:complete len:203 gc:universal NODE_734_length_4350_cov_0.639849:1577-2185(+)